MANAGTIVYQSKGVGNPGITFFKGAFDYVQGTALSINAATFTVPNIPNLTDISVVEIETLAGTPATRFIEVKASRVTGQQGTITIAEINGATPAANIPFQFTIWNP